MDNVALFLAVLGAYLAVFLVIGLVVYVLSSLAHMKALKALGYSKAWMAWIPFVRLYAFADVAADNQESVHMFGSISVPAVLYKFWWWCGSFFRLFRSSVLSHQQLCWWSSLATAM